ncbi:DUF4242 domain-containing protein [Aggregatimonas sangjinii]|nr:DUF4242 domain-containing protein [Aggregatimonas sangjinii]
MKAKGVFKVLIISMVLTTMGSHAQKTDKNQTTKNMESTALKTYLIERDIPNAGQLSQEQLAGIAQKSNAVVAEMGKGLEWVHSYVTENKVYCVYKAENEEALKEHAEKGGFPANSITELATIINPATAKN